MFVTRSALSWAGPGREPVALVPSQDPRAWFEPSAHPPPPWPASLADVQVTGLGLAVNELEQRFLACLCLPAEGRPGS
jgi:hypothetical protein